MSVPGQRAMLLPVMGPVVASTVPQAPAPSDYAQGAPEVPYDRQEATQPVGEFGPPRMPWRALVAAECPDSAARVYRDRWTGDVAVHLPRANRSDDHGPTS
ncbi:hypothetical protein ABZ690_17855 [Streptomyces sp. NPDC006967]|uniref:hypothetical protein n=1 Tax=unclassified Streptomyces TaxID=2593676 RepID=UPI003406D09F